MNLADEIDRLAAQRTAGHLSEAEFEAAKARLFAQSSAGALPPVEGAVSSVNNLRRSVDDRWIGGVCGGLAKMLNVESWIVRLVFVLCLFFAGFGLLPYVLLWIFVPPER